MSSATFYTGDVLQVLAKLPDQSVDLVLTSPPFLALRSYLPADHPDKTLEGGSQSAPGEFIDWLLDVVEACDRVLAPHGSMCFELGDTFAGGGQVPDANHPGSERPVAASKGAGWPADKSLSLIPETFRFALAYGHNPHTGRQTTPWRIRNVIRWVRPNPPVGFLGDKFRPATTEMVVFCRTDEAARRRYFDLDAVREPAKYGVIDPLRGAHKQGSDTRGLAPRWTGTTADQAGNRINSNPAGAPPLDWWEIPTHPYKGSHYATWPPDLCVKPIKAMSPEKVCVMCGEPSRRIVEQTPEYAEHRAQFDYSGEGDDRMALGMGRSTRRGNDRTPAQTETLGWTDCGHDDWRPGVVLDPFAGSGTTLAVAVGHGRNAIGIDLDERNVELARDRVGPMFFHEA